MSRVTQKDIARALDLSPSLVSRALNGRAGEIGILPSTVRRIEETAHSLGYVPNAAARQLKGTGAKILGMVAADMEDPFFGSLIAAIIRASHQRGYGLTMAGFDRRIVDSRDVELLREQHLQGLIVAGSGPLPWAEPFVKMRIPVARIGTGPRTNGIYQVGSDTRTAYRSLLEHIGKLGHVNAGFVGIELDVHRERLAILEQLLANGPITLRKSHIHFTPANTAQAGLAGANALLDAPGPHPSVVICSSDTVALGVLRGLFERGMRVPQDVSVVGYDNLAMAALSTPPLTTIDQPLPAMAEVALDHIARGKPETGEVLLPGVLIARASTGAPKGCRS